MNRREFIAGLGGAVAAWPVVARAQNNARLRRIAVFMPGAADNPEFEARNAAFLQGLGELGWNVGRNITINYRWGGGDVDRYRDFAKEMVAREPDVKIQERVIRRAARADLVAAFHFRDSHHHLADVVLVHHHAVRENA